MLSLLNSKDLTWHIKESTGLLIPCFKGVTQVVVGGGRRALRKPKSFSGPTSLIKLELSSNVCLTSWGHNWPLYLLLVLSGAQTNLALTDGSTARRLKTHFSRRFPSWQIHWFCCPFQSPLEATSSWEIVDSDSSLTVWLLCASGRAALYS